MPAKETPVPAIDGYMLLEVCNGNINGDPDEGGSPRVNSQTERGMVSRESINRKIRDLAYELFQGQPGYELFIRRGSIHERLIKQAYETVGAITEDSVDNVKGNAALCQTYFDVRWFGLVVTKPGDGAIRGPVCVNLGETVYPINFEDLTGTRQTRTNEKRAETGDREMSHRRFVPHAVYVVTWHLDPFYARRTGFDKNDLERFLQVLTLIFRNDHSSTRGRVTLRKFILFEHDEPTRNAEPAELFESIRVEASDPETASKWADYTVTLPDPASLPAGVKMKVVK